MPDRIPLLNLEEMVTLANQAEAWSGEKKEGSLQFTGKINCSGLGIGVGVIEVTLKEEKANVEYSITISSHGTRLGSEIGSYSQGVKTKEYDLLLQTFNMAEDKYHKRQREFLAGIRKSMLLKTVAAS